MTPDYPKLLSPGSIPHYFVYQILWRLLYLSHFSSLAVLYSQMDELH